MQKEFEVKVNSMDVLAIVEKDDLIEGLKAKGLSAESAQRIIQSVKINFNSVNSFIIEFYLKVLEKTEFNVTTGPIFNIDVLKKDAILNNEFYIHDPIVFYRKEKLNELFVGVPEDISKTQIDNIFYLSKFFYNLDVELLEFLTNYFFKNLFYC